MVHKTYYNPDGTKLASEFVNLSIPSCAIAGEYITPSLYNEMIASLKLIHDYGDYDDYERHPLNVSSLQNKTIESKLDISYYNDIANSINKEIVKQNDTILGTYFSDLKEAILNYKMPSSRYYNYDDGQCCAYNPCDCADICFTHDGACWSAPGPTNP